MGVGVRTPSAFLINPAFLSPELVIFSSKMLSLINVIGKVRRTQDLLLLVKNIFFNAWLFRTSRDLDRSGAFS